MCSPKYYQIEYEINPWMSRSRSVLTDKASAQWEELFEIITKKSGNPPREGTGAHVRLIEPHKGLPDMVFTANAGLVHGKTFISSNFRYKERKGEKKYFMKWFKKNGYHVIELPEEFSFEGAGDGLFFGDRLYAGYHFRSDINSHMKISEILKIEVISLELIDKWFYHLDTCFCPIGNEAAIYYPDAFDSYARLVLRKTIPNLIPVAKNEAMRFGCNAVVIGKSVILNTGCPKLKKEISSLGWKVYEAELSEFMKAGGSAKCLTLII